VIAQGLDGRLGVAGERRLHDGPVFSLDVPRLHAIGEEAVPFGLLEENVSEPQQPLRPTARHQGKVVALVQLRLMSSRLATAIAWLADVEQKPSRLTSEVLFQANAHGGEGIGHRFGERGEFARRAEVAGVEAVGIARFGERALSPGGSYG
jgi:hypothetical protein